MRPTGAAMTPQHHTSHPEYHSMTGSTLTVQQQDTMANIAQKRIRGFFLIPFESFMPVAALLGLSRGLRIPVSQGMKGVFQVPPVIFGFPDWPQVDCFVVFRGI